MSLVNEGARYGAGTGIEIFVGTPDRKVDVPIMQSERDVAGRMRQITSHQAATCMRCRC